MAKEYYEKLQKLVTHLKLGNDADIQIKHFFSGAALYVNKTICASWSPGGLAFKLPEHETAKLIKSGKAKPLKYFPKGNIKRGYAIFESPEDSKPNRWKSYFIKSIKLCKNT